jgi:hypothetical protein
MPRGTGFAGASWWSVRQSLLTEINIVPVKLLIVCHTEPERMPNDHGMAINPWSVENGQIDLDGKILVKGKPLSSTLVEEITSAARMYYKYLHSSNFHLWCLHQWFKDLDYIVRDIPFVVHIPCFKQSMYPHTTGIVCKTPLHLEWAKTPMIPNLANHMTVDENQLLADKLYAVITDYMINPDRDREFIL